MAKSYVKGQISKKKVRYNPSMASVKESLKRRYTTAKKRIKKESLILERARCRRQYWQKVAHDIECRLELIKNGQLEMFN